MIPIKKKIPSWTHQHSSLNRFNSNSKLIQTNDSWVEDWFIQKNWLIRVICSQIFFDSLVLKAFFSFIFSIDFFKPWTILTISKKIFKFDLKQKSNRKLEITLNNYSIILFYTFFKGQKKKKSHLDVAPPGAFIKCLYVTATNNFLYGENKRDS